MASGGRITYEDALNSLQAMFPKVDRMVLETILENNGGAMEPAIEQILVIEGDTIAVAEAAREAENAAAAARIAAQQDEGDSDDDRSARRAPSIGVGVPVQQVQPGLVPVPMNGYPGYAAPQQQQQQRRQQHPPQHPQQTQQWRNPVPVDFLRYPGIGIPPLPGQQLPADFAGHGESSGGNARPRGGSTTTPEAQMAADEAMAAMLQNELFLEQVRQDPELADYIRNDPRGAAALGLPVHLILPALQAQDQAAVAAQRAAAANRAGGGGSNWFSGSSTSSSSSSADRPASAGGSTSGSGSSGGGFLTSMQRRLDTLAARFRKNQKVGVAPAGAGSSGAAASSSSSSAAAAGGGSSWFGAGRRSGYLTVGNGAGPNTAAGPGTLLTGDDEDTAGSPRHHVDEGTHTASSGPRASLGGGGGGGGRRVSSARQQHGMISDSTPSGAIEIELTDAPGAIGGGSSGGGPRSGAAASIDMGSISGAARPGHLGASNKAAPGGGGLVKPSSALQASPFAIDDDEEDTEDETAALTGGGRTV